MLSQPFLQAIHVVAQNMDKHHVPWALIGSANCVLQGMYLDPADVDVVVRRADLFRLPEIFSAYTPSLIRPLPTKAINGAPAWDITLTIGGVPVQVAGEEDNGVYVSKLIGQKIVQVPVGDIQVPCFTLDAEAAANVETQRQEKADRIREFIARKR